MLLEIYMNNKEQFLLLSAFFQVKSPKKSQWHRGRSKSSYFGGINCMSEINR